MPCPKGTRTKGLSTRYTKGLRHTAVTKRELTETFLKRTAFIEQKLKEMDAQSDDAAASRAMRASAIDAVPTIEGVMPLRPIPNKRGTTIDVETYRAATRDASASKGVASTSGGLIGRLAFVERTDVGTETVGTEEGDGEDEDGEDDDANEEDTREEVPTPALEAPVERLGSEKRRKAKLKKKLRAKKQRRC